MNVHTAPMGRRRLGRTGLMVSEIGFGSWGTGGESYGPVDDSVSLAVLENAYQRGINFFDTSDLYGNGHSERVLGKALKAVRSDVVIATKGGLLPHTGFAMPSDFSPGHLRDALCRSLERLDTDYVDLYQLHSPELSVLEQDSGIMGALRQFQAEGLIRHYGLSAPNPMVARAALDRFDFAAIQVNFNLIDHRADEQGTLAAAIERDVGVIARTPLCFGYLSGKLSGTEHLAIGDHRAKWPEDQLRRWAQAPGLFDPLIRRRGCSPAQFALLFCLAQPAVSTVIPGLMSIAEVEEDAATSGMAPLTPEELADIAAIYASHQFYEPSAKKRGKA